MKIYDFYQNDHNFCMDDIIVMKFGQNVQNKILSHTDELDKLTVLFQKLFRKNQEGEKNLPPPP